MSSGLTRDVSERLGGAPDLGTVQEIVRRAARGLAHADGATFILRDVDHCFYADEDAISPLWKGQRFPLTRCISGWAMLHGQTVVVPDITADDRIPIESYRPTFVKSLVMVPVGREKPVAAIGAYWARRHTATRHEIAALEELAASAKQAIKRIGLFGTASPPALSAQGYVRGSDPVEAVPRDLAITQDHERIARDLHDTVLQQMFATGLRLQGLAAQIADPAVAEAIDTAVAQIDDTIRDLRGVIFGLEYGHGALTGLSGQILAIVAEAARTLGFSPDVVLDGPLEEVADGMRHEATSALREMLSNVTRHAQATSVRVECVSGPSLVLQVSDDGVGLPARPTRGNGIANLAVRAKRLGGSFGIGPAGERGTRAVWSVPAR